MQDLSGLPMGSCVLRPLERDVACNIYHTYPPAEVFIYLARYAALKAKHGDPGVQRPSNLQYIGAELHTLYTVCA